MVGMISRQSSRACGRGSYKVPDGKLVNADVRLISIGPATWSVASVRFDGDFFEDLFVTPATAITGMRVREDEPVEDITSSAAERIQRHRVREHDGSAVRCSLRDADARASALAAARAIVTALERAGARSGTKGKQGNERTNPTDAANQADGAIETYVLKRGVPYTQIVKESVVRDRWRALGPVWLVPPRVAMPLSPSRQMACDEALAELMASGHLRRPVLRFWRWRSPAVVLGAFQSVSHEVDVLGARRRGVCVVRRTTGGGAMLSRPRETITWSMVTPGTFVEGLTAEQAYALCDSWVFDGLQRLGIEAVHEPVNDIASQWGKIGGSAAKRLPCGRMRRGAQELCGGVLLHHSMLSYDADARVLDGVLHVNGEKFVDKAVRSSGKRVTSIRSVVLRSAVFQGDDVSRIPLKTEVENSMLEAVRQRAVVGMMPARQWSVVESVARRLDREQFGTRQWTWRIA
ncbi:MAG: hypothetical protein IIT36_03635 [Aeriscardovia sp.]|nr:hypothetical protein [Aeriscardovia sp.]